MGAIYVLEGRLLRIRWDAERRKLRVDWTDATDGMSEDEFKRTLGWIADHVAERKARALFIDAGDFRHDVSAEVQQWRLRQISPRLNAAGLERLAFLFPNGAESPPMANQSAEGERFVTRAFNNEEHAIAWLTAGGRGRGDR